MYGHLRVRVLTAVMVLWAGIAAALDEACAEPVIVDEHPALPEVLDLETAQRWALAENPSLQMVAEQVAQTHELVRQARSLYFPQIDASYSAAHTWLGDGVVPTYDTGRDRNTRRTRRGSRIIQDVDVDETVPYADLINDAVDVARRIQQDIAGLMGTAQEQLSALTVEGDTLDTYSLGLSAGFILFDGFAREFNNAMARFGYRESQAAQREAHRMLLSAVARTYYGVLLARENIEVAKADEAFNKRLLKDAKSLRQVGKGSTSDVLNFEVAARLAQASLLMAEGDYQTARIALAFLMGLPGARLPDDVRLASLPGETPDDMQVPDADLLIQYALGHRPDVLQNEYGSRRAAKAVKARYAEFVPQVALFASRDARSNENSKFDWDDFSTTVGVNVSYNLFSGGRRASRVIEAKHARRQADYRLKDAELNVASDVRQAVVKLKTSQHGLVLQRTTTEYVERSRALVEKEYAAGKGALVRLNQVQRDLVRAQAQLVLARVSLHQSWHDVRTATGETLEVFDETEE